MRCLVYTSDARIKYKGGWACSQYRFLDKECSIVTRANEMAASREPTPAAGAATTPEPTPAEKVERLEKGLARYTERYGELSDEEQQ
jgi:hypothetical protein